MLRTTSQLISHHTQLEDQQTLNYSKLAETFPEHSEVFTKLAKENKKHRDMIARAYREGVTDAFEVGFNPEPLNPDNYVIQEIDAASLDTVIKQSLINEETLIRFCIDASKGSSQLIPDIPDTFDVIIRRKNKRKALLESMLG